MIYGHINKLTPSDIYALHTRRNRERYESKICPFHQGFIITRAEPWMTLMLNEVATRVLMNCERTVQFPGFFFLARQIPFKFNRGAVETRRVPFEMEMKGQATVLRYMNRFAVTLKKVAPSLHLAISPTIQRVGILAPKKDSQ